LEKQLIKLTITINEKPNPDTKSAFQTLYTPTLATAHHTATLGTCLSEEDAMKDALNHAQTEWRRGDYGKLFPSEDSEPLTIDVTSTAPGRYRLGANGYGIVDVQWDGNRAYVEYSTAGDNTKLMVNAAVEKRLFY
jgi:hypothetical protein